MEYVYSYVPDTYWKAASYSMTTNATFLVIDSVQGIVSGIPDRAGDYAVNITATNSYGSAVQSYVLHVEEAIPVEPVTPDEDDPVIVFSPPSFISVPLRELGAGTDYSYLAFAYGQGLTYSLSSNATFLSIDANSGYISGTADSERASYYLIISASNSSGTAWQNFTLFVNVTIPLIVTMDIPEVLIGDDFSCVLEANCRGLAFSMSTNAPFLTIDTVQGVISGTPEKAGDYIVNVTATNSNGSTMRSFVLKVMDNVMNFTSGTIISTSSIIGPIENGDGVDSVSSTIMHKVLIVSGLGLVLFAMVMAVKRTLKDSRKW